MRSRSRRPCRWSGACLAALLVATAAAAEEQPIALLGALAGETQPVAAALSDARPLVLAGIPCLSGTLAGRPVLLATIGVGKVNAAMATALVVERFSPAVVIFTGVAGGLDPELQPGDVVVGERHVQHDLVTHTEQGPVLRGVRNAAGVVGPLVLEASPALVALARQVAGGLELERTAGATRAPRVRFGTIATGDSFVGAQAKKTELRERLSADAVEMEGAAVAQVCVQLGVPFLVVRGLSDRAAADAPEEARRNLALAARNAARAALAVAQAFAAGGRR